MTFNTGSYVRRISEFEAVQYLSTDDAAAIVAWVGSDQCYLREEDGVIVWPEVFQANIGDWIVTDLADTWYEVYSDSTFPKAFSAKPYSGV